MQNVGAESMDLETNFSSKGVERQLAVIFIEGN